MHMLYMREANCSGHLHPAWHLTASILHILSASLKLLKVKSYIAFCGKKIPEGLSCLCYCVSSWKHKKWWWWRTGYLYKHSDLTSWAGAALDCSRPWCWCSPAHNTSLHICSVQKLHGPPSTVQRWLSDLLHCPREHGSCKEPATMQGCQEISAVWV